MKILIFHKKEGAMRWPFSVTGWRDLTSGKVPKQAKSVICFQNDF
jgi:hypothetical protein